MSNSKLEFDRNWKISIYSKVSKVASGFHHLKTRSVFHNYILGANFNVVGIWLWKSLFSVAPECWHHFCFRRLVTKYQDSRCHIHQRGVFSAPLFLRNRSFTVFVNLQKCLFFSSGNFVKWDIFKDTVFENQSKYHIWVFQCLHFPPIFVPLKLTCLVTLFDLQIDYFKSRIWIFCHFLPCYDLSGNTFWPRTSANFLQWLPDGQGVE